MIIARPWMQSCSPQLTTDLFCRTVRGGGPVAGVINRSGKAWIVMVHKNCLWWNEIQIPTLHWHSARRCGPTVRNFVRQVYESSDGHLFNGGILYRGECSFHTRVLWLIPSTWYPAVRKLDFTRVPASCIQWCDVVCHTLSYREPGCPFFHFGNRKYLWFCPLQCTFCKQALRKAPLPKLRLLGVPELHGNYDSIRSAPVNHMLPSKSFLE